MRLNKVVAAFIHKHLVARVNCAPSDDFTAMAKPTGKDVEILMERVRRGVYENALPLADQSRKRKKERDLSRHNFKDLIIFARDDVDVIATQNNELCDLSQNVWR